MQRPLSSRFTNGAVVEQRDIEIFLTLAEELHFGRTAERLHVSTARVSQSIAKWERRVGVPLFERTSRRVALTPVGRQLYEDVGPAYRQLLAGIERAVTAGRDIRGLLRVGSFSAAGGRLVVEVADAFRARYPFPEQATRYHQRPDVAFVPIQDAPPFKWRFLWRPGTGTARVRAFAQTAQDTLSTRAATP